MDSAPSDIQRLKILNWRVERLSEERLIHTYASDKKARLFLKSKFLFTRISSIRLFNFWPRSGPTVWARDHFSWFKWAQFPPKHLWLEQIATSQNPRRRTSSMHRQPTDWTRSKSTLESATRKPLKADHVESDSPQGNEETMSPSNSDNVRFRTDETAKIVSVIVSDPNDPVDAFGKGRQDDQLSPVKESFGDWTEKFHPQRFSNRKPISQENRKSQQRIIDSSEQWSDPRSSQAISQRYFTSRLTLSVDCLGQRRGPSTLRKRPSGAYRRHLLAM